LHCRYDQKFSAPRRYRLIVDFCYLYSLLLPSRKLDEEKR
jgi:hypothetical protein